MGTTTIQTDHPRLMVRALRELGEKLERESRSRKWSGPRFADIRLDLREQAHRAYAEAGQLRTQLDGGRS